MKLNKKDLPPTDGVWKHSSARWCSELNGQLHNSLGPAVVYDDGSKQWCVNGELHRLEGPAVEYADGDKEWCVNGKYHRLDGPAIEWADGHKEWHVDGKYILERDFPSAVISFLLSVDEETAELIEQEIEQ